MTLAPRSDSSWIVGMLARTRPSSVMRRPSSGTFRSDRTSTRLPRTSPRASRVELTSERGADEGRQVDQAVGVAPLVVVPADHLNLVAVGQGAAGVDRAGGGPGDDVGADDLVLGVF